MTTRTTPRRAAFYLRVSTGEQTTENQRRELDAVAERAGWDVVEVYEDAGISGAKGRDKRPAFDRLLKDATRRRFDVVAAWSVDRLGRSLPHLVGFLEEIHAAGVDLYLHRQGLDTSTPAGKAMFGMLGVFSEFERAMIQERVKAGLARARANGTRLGRPTLPPEVEAAIRATLNGGTGILKTARLHGVGTAAVQRIAAEMKAEARAAPPAPALPAEPHSYRRPDPDAPGDPRCQAKRRDGGRCKERTAAVVFVPDHRGQRAEFGACHRHKDDFIPHKSIFVLNDIKL